MDDLYNSFFSPRELQPTYLFIHPLPLCPPSSACHPPYTIGDICSSPALLTPNHLVPPPNPTQNQAHPSTPKLSQAPQANAGPRSSLHHPHLHKPTSAPPLSHSFNQSQPFPSTFETKHISPHNVIHITPPLSSLVPFLLSDHVIHVCSIRKVVVCL